MGRFRTFALSIVSSGAVFGLFLIGRWGWALVVLAVQALLYYLDVEALFMRIVAGWWSGLTMIVPVHPLDPGVSVPPDVAKRRAKVGVKSVCSAAARARRVDLMLASGYQVVGHRKGEGWLLEALKKMPPGSRIRVLLLDPDSPGTERRGKEVMRQHGWRKYREGIRAVLWTLRRLSEDQDIAVEVRLYQEDPIWQMILLPTELWVLVSAGARSTETSPMYVLRRRWKYSLAWGMEAVWARRWEHETTKRVDLATLEQPKWDNVV